MGVRITCEQIEGNLVVNITKKFFFIQTVLLVSLEIKSNVMNVCYKYEQNKLVRTISPIQLY